LIRVSSETCALFPFAISGTNGLAQASGVDLQRFRGELLEEFTKAKRHADIEPATRLKVSGIPLFPQTGGLLQGRRFHFRLPFDILFSKPAHFQREALTVTT